MSTSFTAVANTNTARPTGELGIMNGMTSPIIPMQVPPSQQINVGDVICQLNATTYGYVGVPDCALPSALAETATSSASVSAAAMKDVHDAFAGISLSYRTSLDTSYGKPKDRISVANGRVKFKLEPTDYNFQNFLPAGTLVGAVPVVAGSSSSWTIASLKASYVQTTTLNALGTSAGAGSVAVTPDHAIGRLAYDKQAGDSFVWADTVSTILSGGPQPVATA